MMIVVVVVEVFVVVVAILVISCSISISIIIIIGIFLARSSYSLITASVLVEVNYGVLYTESVDYVSP